MRHLTPARATAVITIVSLFFIVVGCTGNPPPPKPQQVTTVAAPGAPFKTLNAGTNSTATPTTPAK